MWKGRENPEWGSQTTK